MTSRSGVEKSTVGRSPSKENERVFEHRASPIRPL